MKYPALAWSTDSFEATLGSENVFPTLTNIYQLNVSYESSQPEVATVSSSGAITLVGAGSTLITASFAANGSYSASSTSYLLTVVNTSGCKLSGHTKYDTFKRYVRLSLDEYADDIAKSAENCLF